MKRLKVYVDTSVFGGCFDHELAEWSNALMGDFRDDRCGLVVSDVTAGEVAAAPEPARELFSELLETACILPVTAEVLELLGAYEAHNILGPRFRNDMLHIAVATVAEVDVVVRWNFTHRETGQDQALQRRQSGAWV